MIINNNNNNNNNTIALTAKVLLLVEAHTRTGLLHANTRIIDDVGLRTIMVESCGAIPRIPNTNLG